MSYIPNYHIISSAVADTAVEQGDTVYRYTIRRAGANAEPIIGVPYGVEYIHTYIHTYIQSAYICMYVCTLYCALQVQDLDIK